MTKSSPNQGWSDSSETDQPCSTNQKFSFCLPDLCPNCTKSTEDSL